MGGENNSELIRLIRGEGASLWLSRGERQLLKFALKAFGEPLSRFLLSGLGEEEEGRIWLFTVTFTDKKGESHSREIRVEADDLPDVITVLPRRREPLVMLSLLQLLMGRQPFSPSMFYDQKEVLTLLGWEDNSSSSLSIDKTVERYADLSYKWELSKEELKEKNLSNHRAWARLVSGYGLREVEEIQGESIKRISNRIDFSAEFVRELISRSLFDINWNSVQSIARKLN